MGMVQWQDPKELFNVTKQPRIGLIVPYLCLFGAHISHRSTQRPGVLFTGSALMIHKVCGVWCGFFSCTYVLKVKMRTTTFKKKQKNKTTTKKLGSWPTPVTHKSLNVTFSRSTAFKSFLASVLLPVNKPVSLALLSSGPTGQLFKKKKKKTQQRPTFWRVPAGRRQVDPWEPHSSPGSSSSHCATVS